ncbi:MAG TPA: SusC/RagA family TonB-linked outer membrane protein [Gemmatimonadaceae bacterium]|nr:SusC/RagA family TonB-linked outer membrane protein [Gemmatimonadaceae bacterium]
MRLRFRLSVLSAVLVAAPLGAQQRGAIVGRVTDKSSATGVPAATVMIAGTTRGTQTGSDGRYRIQSLPVGTAVVRVLRLGFESQNKTVTITDGQTDTVDFVLTPSVVTLDQVVVSAAGEQQRQRETGNAVANISPDSIAQPAVADFSDMLNSRAPGVSIVQQSGTTGGASKIRIRGANSVSLSNDPLLVIDGNRVDNSTNSASSNLFTGGQTPSRFDDLNPDEIEDVQILKGPAASALYGTAGSNGVILVTTKHGVPGRTKWNSHAEYGSVRTATTYPPNFFNSGIALDNNGAPIAGDTVQGCELNQHGLPGGCNVIPSSVIAFSPMNTLSPFVAGYRESYGITASGGTENLTYFLGADDYNEQGIYINNRQRRTNLRGNFGAQLSPVLNASLNVGYLQSRLSLPQNDNSLYGVIGLALTGTAFNDPVCHGYFACVTPAKANLNDAESDIDRYTGSGTINYHPTSWFSGVATGGIDYADRFDGTFVPAGVLPGSQGSGLGEAAPAPYQLYDYTANLSAIFKFDLTPSIHSTTTLGTQFVDEARRGITAQGFGIVPGTGNLGGATSQFGATESDTDIVTFGGLGSQEFAWRDKMFLTAAIRADESSAFGKPNDLIWYPDFSASWVIGEEPWFPKVPGMSSLRLRGAYGESGQRPSFLQAQTFRSPVGQSRQGIDEGGLTIGGFGFSSLKPEISREIEGGLDAGFFKDRVNVNFTVYNKTTSDALIQVQEAPDVCGNNVVGLCQLFQNLGTVNNNGFELGISGVVIDTKPFRFDMTINGSENNNKLLKLGLPAPIFFNAAINDNVQQFSEGRALGTYYAIPYTYKDLNHDGIIEQNELTLGKNPVYLGGPNPKGEWTLSPQFTIFGFIKVSSTFDRRYGSRTLNFTEEFRCFASFLCSAQYNPRATLQAQAAYVGAENGTDFGYIENNAFWKWRELAVTFLVPQKWIRRTPFSELNIQLAERNVATWTKYSGYDPEINFVSTGSNFTTADFLTQPLVRYLTMRINVGL